MNDEKRNYLIFDPKYKFDKLCKKMAWSVGLLFAPSFRDTATYKRKKR
jgi:hypothetical protein